MRNRTRFILCFLILLSGSVTLAIESGAPRQKTEAFVGQDLHLVGRELISYQLSTGEHTLIFQNGFSLSIGANQFSSDSAVVWLESVAIEFGDRVRINYKTITYLQGNVLVKKGKGAKTTYFNQTVLEDGQAMIVQFEVSGEVFVTADERVVADPH